MEETRRNIVIQGMDLPDVEWRLYDDGTLCFTGKGELSCRGFRLYRSHIRRIEICGFETVAPYQFEALPNLEEVDLGETLWVVSEGAFRGCPKLTRVLNLQNVIVGDDAFADTPCTAVTAEPAPSPAQRFWEEMARCLATLKSPYKDSFQLRPAIRLLYEGAKEGDPELMYLWAEYLKWGDEHLFWRFGDGYAHTVQYLWDEDEEEEDDDSRPNYWYTRAADAGYAPAICWLGWTALQGIGMRPDHRKARAWFDLAGKGRIDSLEPENIGLFARTAADLEDLAHDADIEEDYYCTDPDYVPANPTWRDLHGSALAVYFLGCMFGSLECTTPETYHLIYDYGYWPDNYSYYQEDLALERYLCQIWCGLEGILRVSSETLRRWLVKAHHLKDSAQASARQATLLEELTVKVLFL